MRSEWYVSEWYVSKWYVVVCDMWYVIVCDMWVSNMWVIEWCTRGYVTARCPVLRLSLTGLWRERDEPVRHTRLATHCTSHHENAKSILMHYGIMKILQINVCIHYVIHILQPRIMNISHWKHDTAYRARKESRLLFLKNQSIETVIIETVITILFSRWKFAKKLLQPQVHLTPNIPSMKVIVTKKGCKSQKRKS